MFPMYSQPFRMGSDGGGSAGPDASGSSLVPAWLLKAKVMPAKLPARYVRRAPLLQRLDGLRDRRLTVLRAPAGFGKTTVLADVARSIREGEGIVAWVSLDDDDTPDVFGSYLACAFEHGGLDLGLLNAEDTWSSSPAVHQIGMLARAIELHGGPCLLALDEVDRLPPRTIQLIDLLLRRAPPNLHLALACRSDPGLDVATQLLAGEAAVVGAEEFRFSKADIARLFDGELSRRELAAVEERTAGWPVALLVYRNMRSDEAGHLGADTAVFTENYIGVRLLRDLSVEDRAFLLDLAVFDWIEADLVDEVLDSSKARMRITGLRSLDGLLLPVDGDPMVRRLHPLLREYCLDLLAVEDLARKGALHKRIALALVQRGHLTPAWRHARAAGERRLVGELIERFGVFQLWLREGAAQLVSADQFLAPEITASSPRLELLRSVILRLSSNLDEAQALFEAVGRNTDGFTRDRDGGDDDWLAVDRLFAQAVLTGGAGAFPRSEVESGLPAEGRAVDGDARSRAIAGARHTWLCVGCHERADFDKSRHHGLQARKHFTEDLRYGRIFVDICLGMSAMAQGRVQEAAQSYARARQGVRKLFSSDPCLTVSIDVVMMELDLERDRAKAIQQRTLKSLTELREVWADMYGAALALSAELTFNQYDAETVIQRLTTVVDDVRAKGIASLSNSLSALLAYYLVEVGRPDEAERLWRDHDLPGDVAELLDLDRQSWRTMEALACARIRLLAEQGASVAAEELAARLCGTASEHGLARTVLRALALSMRVAHGAGRPARAQAHLVEFLRRTREVDYIRPLVRQCELSRTLLRELLGTDLDEDLRRAAESTLARLDESPDADTSVFSLRELEVLAEVRQGLRNGEIAGRLGITDDGVRYHLKSIYRKAGVSSRTDAVRYAESLGVLSQA